MSNGILILFNLDYKKYYCIISNEIGLKINSYLSPLSKFNNLMTECEYK